LSREVGGPSEEDGVFARIETVWISDRDLYREVEAPDLEKTLEAMETTVEPQEHHKEEANMDNVWSLGDRYDDRRLVVRRS
jgi:hypothetical protein